jgi:hypothetical protein
MRDDFSEVCNGATLARRSNTPPYCPIAKRAQKRAINPANWRGISEIFGDYRNLDSCGQVAYVRANSIQGV